MSSKHSGTELAGVGTNGGNSTDATNPQHRQWQCPRTRLQPQGIPQAESHHKCRYYGIAAERVHDQPAAIAMASRGSATSSNPAMPEPSQPRTQQALETGRDQSLGNSSIRGSWSEDQQLQRRQQSRQQQVVATATGPEATGETNYDAATAPRATSSMPTEVVGTVTQNESDRVAAVEAAGILIGARAGAVTASAVRPVQHIVTAECDNGDRKLGQPTLGVAAQ
jgi:hypothetical protein